MQRQIVHGVPYFTDAANKLYIWDAEQPAYSIGTYDPIKKTVEYESNHRIGLKDRLAAWRSKQVARSRKPQATNSGTNGESTNGNTAETSDADE